jgi:hypothetical protein
LPILNKESIDFFFLIKRADQTPNILIRPLGKKNDNEHLG